MTDSSEVITISRRRFNGAVFDLDGVLTDTARVHAAAWKTVFDEFLRHYAARTSAAARPFDARADYLAHVDGRSRADGVREFLASRGINLPEGAINNPTGDTIQGLAVRKDALVQEGLRRHSEILPGAEEVLRALKQVGIGTAVASSSANCALVLSVTGLDRFVDVRVDGITAAELGLPGKPSPALFLEAVARLGISPGRAILFEDALPGTEAGRRGGFGCVVGVDRGGQALALRKHGADVVISHLTQVRVVEE
jgi:beta-phosphoglucomutase family hydrolase